MIKNITFLLSLLLCSLGLSAQTIKTDVTVIGGTPAGITAGIQAARSGVKSLILEEGKSLSADFSPADLITLERIRDHYVYQKVKASGVKDSVKRPAFQPGDAIDIKSITDTVKNLTVMLNTSIRKIEKDGKGWEIKLQNGRTVKTDVIIDAGKAQTISQFLKIDQKKTIIPINTWVAPPALAPLYRTSVASIQFQKNAINAVFLIPAAQLMPAGVENIFHIPQDSNPQAMLAGQAAGASAAFCAYFKTTSKNLNVRVTQGELLAFDARLMPYEDIQFSDRHAIAFQHIGLTGILRTKTVSNDDRQVFLFDTLSTVSSNELRQTMKEYYSRSQIWFADHKKDSLTIDDAVSLLMFTATRGEELRREIESGWKISFKFSSTYDPKRAINRREFAVLTDTYLQPFSRRIDLNGNLLN